MPTPALLSESAGVLAILKPAGLATQAPFGIPSVEAWVRDLLHGGDRTGYVGVPHRLDRAVSGVLLMAATPRAARKISRQFERRQVTKTYLAVVGVSRSGDTAAMAADVATEWRDLVEKIPDHARSRIADPSSSAAREAITYARHQPTQSLAEAPSDAMLLQLEPQTGRMHQLRLQAAVRGLPILGDHLYGGAALSVGPGDGLSEDLSDDVRVRPILLHAWRIAYVDPDSDEPVTIEAPLPDHWPAWARPETTRREPAADA